MLRIEVATSLRAVRNINENVFCRDTLTHLTAAKYPRCSPRCTLCVSSHPLFILVGFMDRVFAKRIEYVFFFKRTRCQKHKNYDFKACRVW